MARPPMHMRDMEHLLPHDGTALSTIEDDDEEAQDEMPFRL
jgi:hypothetical protein